MGPAGEEDEVEGGVDEGEERGVGGQEGDGDGEGEDHEGADPHPGGDEEGADGEGDGHDHEVGEDHGVHGGAGRGEQDAGEGHAGDGDQEDVEDAAVVGVVAQDRAHAEPGDEQQGPDAQALVAVGGGAGRLGAEEAVGEDQEVDDDEDEDPGGDHAATQAGRAGGVGLEVDGELGEQGLHARPALGGVEREAAEQGLVQAWGQLDAGRRVAHAAAGDGAVELVDGVAGEGALAVEGLEEGGAERELVAAGVGRAAAELLGGHVRGRADDRSDVGERGGEGRGHVLGDR